MITRVIKLLLVMLAAERNEVCEVFLADARVGAVMQVNMPATAVTALGKSGVPVAPDDGLPLR